MKHTIAILTAIGMSSLVQAAPLPPNYTNVVYNCLPRLLQTSFMTAKYQGQRPAGTVIDELVLHDTASGRNRQWNDATSYMASPGDGRVVSIHYMVGKEDGQIVNFVSEANQAWHVKAGDHNRHSIGIEIFRRIGEDPFYTAWQLESVAELVYDIMLRNRIPYSRVVGHGQLQDNRVDPENFDWPQLEDRLYELDDCARPLTNIAVM